MSFLPKTKTDGNVTLRHKNYMKNFDLNGNPDLEHKIRLSTSVRNITAIPVEKTDEEIARMHEYNRMMGKR